MRGRALVTGASSGLGTCFARQLAAAGNDLVLVARTTGALERLAGELRAAHGTDAEVLPADLGDRAQLAAVADRIGAGDVDTVVNNAGFGFYGPVAGHDLDQELGMVDVDVAAVVALSHAAARVMVPRRRGALLNVSSVASFAPTPESATYSAAKSFVLFFTEALHDELAPDGVHVSVLCPGFTRTNFQANAGISGKGLPRLRLGRGRRRRPPGPRRPGPQQGRLRPGPRQQGHRRLTPLRSPGPHPPDRPPGDEAALSGVRAQSDFTVKAPVPG